LKIAAGYDIAFECFQETPMVLMLSVHPSRQPDLLKDHFIRFSPKVNAREYLDTFGNICTCLVAPPGLMEIRNEFMIGDSGLPDEVAPDAVQIPLDELPDDAWFISWGADIAIQRSCPNTRGKCSAILPAAGNECRQFVTMSTTVLSSDTITPEMTGRHSKGTRNESAFAAILRIWL